jgi:phosphatidylglycerol:prolipoprotein diacylglycerol transferase
MAVPGVNNQDAIAWTDLGLSPVALDLGFFELRWYSLAYLAGIFVGYWYLLKLIKQPGAPMARRHADDMVFYAALGIILGGRLGYVLFYNPGYYLENPLDILKLWDGGMSFHGGVLGTTLGILYLARKEGLPWLRIHDYVACCVPFGLFFGRLANFVNHELWGAPTNVPWAVRFPEVVAGLTALGPPRHPSQLYEAALEGLLLFALLAVLIRMGALKRPGLVVGVFAVGYGLARSFAELFREPDPQLGFLWGGLTMGMLLSVPMIAAGLAFIVAALRRKPAAAT